eukprot:1158690-Pelagomonas_calceolata.AAC.1
MNVPACSHLPPPMQLTVLDQADPSGEDASTFFHLLGEPDAAAAASRVQPSGQSPVSMAVAASDPAAASTEAAAASSIPRLFALDQGRAPTEIPGPPSRPCPAVYDCQSSNIAQVQLAHRGPGRP